MAIKNLTDIKKELDFLTRNTLSESKEGISLFFQIFSAKKFCEYISLKEFVKILWKCTSKYNESINSLKGGILLELGVFSSKDDELIIKENTVYVYYHDHKKLLVIDCTMLPKLVKGNEEDFDKVKKHLYSLIPLYNKYIKFLDSFEKTINVSEHTKIIISNKYGIAHPSVSIKIGDIALFEIQYDSDINYINLITYSTDCAINDYIESNKEKLFKQILIFKSKIPYLLSEYEKK